jgi:four helix bundle protein
MKTDNVVQDKSYSFALRIVRLYQYLSSEKKEYVLAKQIVKSGTSIGANVEEAIGGQSRRDFYARMTVAYKEARETHYWLRLLRDARYIMDNDATSIIADCEELLKIIGAILRTMKEGEKENN